MKSLVLKAKCSITFEMNVAPTPGMGHFGPGGTCPAEFSSTPNQTHLTKLINVFKITRKLQAGVFD